MNYIQYEIKDGQLMTPKPIAIHDIKNLEVKILPAKKDTFDTILNSIATMASSSLANGDEHVFVVINITLNSKETITLPIHKEYVVRNNLDYHDAVKQARKLIETLKRGKTMTKEFENIVIDPKERKFKIIDGTTGEYSLDDIDTISILNEQASFKGKGEPFLHQVLGGITFSSGAMEPQLYVGLKIKMKDGNKLALYVSKKPVNFNSDIYHHDVKEAQNIKSLLNKFYTEKIE